MAAKPPKRIVIQYPAPSVDGEPPATKRCVGARVVVEADIFRDGHELLCAVVLYHGPGRWTGDRIRWREAEMQRIDAHVDRMRWTGTFDVDRPGTWTYTIEAWIDVFGTWRCELERKVEAGQHDLDGEMLEGIVLLREVADVAEVEADRAVIKHALISLKDPAVPESVKYNVALAPKLLAAVERVQLRHGSVVLEKPVTIEVVSPEGPGGRLK